MRLAPLSREDMERNHALARDEKKASAEKTGTTRRPANVDVVLDLGNETFFHFRGRAYGVPPLPWREGQKLLSVWLDITSAGDTLTNETAPKYYAALRKIPALLWRNCRPAGRGLRFCRALGLMRNPFHTATERELVEYANFFLLRRMRSGDSLPSVRMANRPAEIT